MVWLSLSVEKSGTDKMIKFAAFPHQHSFPKTKVAVTVTKIKKLAMKLKLK